MDLDNLMTQPGIEKQQLDPASGVPQDLLDYLHTMITPDQGETLIALDLAAVDWSQYEEHQLHGIIARGDPSEYLDEIWRVLRPGAHVMLIAPEEQPTGHTGACALEDRGFEIRDAILWVREAGNFHYVPKASSRERNAGCGELAKRRKGPPTYVIPEDVSEEEVAEMQEALIEAGVDEEVVDNIQEMGIDRDLVPKEFWPLLVKSPDSSKYGNSHPTVKPVGVLERLLSDVPKDATVLDPFMGSGSMGLACLQTGHNYIGIEREAEYLEIADTRVRHWNSQLYPQQQAEVVSDHKLEHDPSVPEKVEDLTDFFDFTG